MAERIEWSAGYRCVDQVHSVRISLTVPHEVDHDRRSVCGRRGWAAGTDEQPAITGGPAGSRGEAGPARAAVAAVAE